MEIYCIVVIVALAIELFYKPIRQYKGFEWMIQYRDWIISLYKNSIYWNGALGVLSVLAIPLLIIMLFQWFDFMNESLWGIPGIVFSLLVLLYCLTYSTLDQVIDQLSDQSKEQSYGPNKKAIIEVLGDEFTPAENNNEALIKAILVQANERTYAVVFWFLILGPVGAVLYRFTEVLSRQTINPGARHIELDDFDTNARRLYGILSWIPARLSAIGYALAGGFEDAVNNWREVKTDKPTKMGRYNFVESNELVLYHAGRGAIEVDRYYVTDEIDPEGSAYMSFDGVRAAQGLVLRTLLIWAAIVALIFLAAIAT